VATLFKKESMSDNFKTTDIPLRTQRTQRKSKDREGVQKLIRLYVSIQPNCGFFASLASFAVKLFFSDFVEIF
jgi:hypothetical protein